MEIKKAVKVDFSNNHSWKMYSGKDIFLDDNIVCLARVIVLVSFHTRLIKTCLQMAFWKIYCKCIWFAVFSFVLLFVLSFCFQYALNSLQKPFLLYFLHLKCQKDSCCENCLNFSCKIYYSLVFHYETLWERYDKKRVKK